jgi:hypothetical protein
MGVGTTAIALLPTYEAAGIDAFGDLAPFHRVELLAARRWPTSSPESSGR